MADFRNTSLTIGPHPMRFHRAQMDEIGVRRAVELKHLRDGQKVRVAGAVICRQRPGTAKGFVFLSLEDETGIANAILTPDLFDRVRPSIIHEPFLLIEGTLQDPRGAISVKATHIEALPLATPSAESHDFH